MDHSPLPSGELPVEAPDNNDAIEADKDIEAPASDPHKQVSAVPYTLIVELSGYWDGRATWLPGDSALIGRRGDGLVLTLSHDAWVSQAHAQLDYHDGAWWLTDLNSTNGTWLEATGERVTDAVQVDLGVVFRVGHTDLMLSDDAALVPAEPLYT